MKVGVIIPAYNEEQSIAKVISAIPKDKVSEIVVVNNNSNDNTEREAITAGAVVLSETFQGYGACCLKGIEYFKPADVDTIVFIDGDYSDFPEEIDLLLEPIKNKNYDFVIGSRVLGKRERGALPFQSQIGSLVAGFLIKAFWGIGYTDLGPFRAIKKDKLLQLNMKDKWYGWTVEMQIKAIKNNLKIAEVPISYRKRIGKSKVTGTVKGTVFASTIILKTIFSELFED